MKKILTCTDGSLYAASIYDHSIWVARRTGASIHIIHMLDAHRERASSVDLSGNLTLDTDRELLQDLVSLEEKANRVARERGRLVLDDAMRHIKASGLTSVTTEQQHGELVETVTQMESGHDLIVLGKRGESSDFAKQHLGSNLERVIRASIRPVLVASRKFVPMEKFLLAYDGGPSVEKAVNFLTDQPLLRGMEGVLLRAGHIDDNARWYLEETAGKLRDAGYTITVLAIDKDPEQAICETLAREHIQLLVMGAYGHSRIRHLLVGSTTTAMVRTCRVPVLMFR